ncbi:peptidoglycan-binding domain-containing protein [Nakamurella multipartita]|uniref:Peptidoglycan-binding domain 1 protein n=1 Tax=Nakamurella multipartita (strain ATCC 700099 / DSM 44233 / CIP 104796 / JCM 9543 / NBRC 105858 / Y-104) TaxID=479431 RepID=C8X9M8_NAKMY|nr:peptidoglycan-binding protein [Nakamurella multipartita]ACV79186.1 Peptidoglycan-binding domain 1 protein [Nakamurella multipartita DSM 44233]
MVDRARGAPHSRSSDPRRADSPAAGRPRAPEHRIAQLQRQVGNRVVTEYVRALNVQRVKEGDGPTNDIGIIQQQLNHVGASPRLAITGRFDAATTTATKAFQKKLIAEGVAGVTEDGIVDGITHTQLKTRAPSVVISATETVVDGPGATQVPSNPAAGTHAQLQVGAKGVAVKELQERLNNSGVAGAKLLVDGIFGPKTDAGLKTFQGTIPVAATGIADPATWTKLETAGAASQGHVEFDWLEEVEGVKNVGLRAGYDWKLSKTALAITLGITFHKKHKNVDTRIGQWLADIKEIWSTFKAVNDSDPKKKSMDLNFEAKRGPGHDVDVFQFDPKLPKKDRGQSRSDSGTWYTVDKRRSMAPHEFGHLIGLADEYNRIEEHYLQVTGEEPAVGNTAGLAADATKLAGDIKAQLPLTDKIAAPAATDDPGWGTSLAAVITPKLGTKQGGFSRFVAQEYGKANAGASVYTDIQKAFSDKGVTGFQANLSACVTPFLYSNKSLMGTMETTPAKGGGGKAAPAHEHPIEPRHIQPFVDLLAREWAMQTGKADKWRPERR